MIEVRDLFKVHGGRAVLRGVSFSVKAGEVAAIIGASGSGKSTLLRSLNGLEPIESGSIEVSGRALPSGPPGPRRDLELKGIRRQVGFVFQSYGLFPHLSVLDNLTVAPVHAHGVPRSRAEAKGRELLDRVGLLDRASARPRELSGGQQQRVAIARALANDPKVILFDEPTSALDPRMSTEILALIRGLARDGLTIVVVTHAMEFAGLVAQAVHVLHEGRIVESGPPARIFDDPAHEATRLLLGRSVAVADLEASA